MTEESMDYKIGRLVGRVNAIEADLHEIKESTKAISSALTQGKGIFLGLMIASASGGALISELIKKWIH